MSKIEKSMTAIQTFKPEENIYLKVVGSGKEQHLEAVKINWLGRLLMWLGCSSSSMIKIIRFIEQNIQNLFRPRAIDLKDDKNALGRLLGKISRFNIRHHKSISKQVFQISNAYEKYRQPSEVVKPVATPTNSPKTLPTAATPANSPRTPSSVSPTHSPHPIPAAPPVTIINPFVQPPKPSEQPEAKVAPPLVVVAPLVSSAISQPPNVCPVQEAVNRFKAVRGHIEKVSCLFNGIENSSVPLAAKEMQEVRKLLIDCLNFPDRFAAVIKEMTPQEVESYAAFNVSNYKKKYSTEAKKIYENAVFSINSKTRFSPSQCLKMAIQFMTVEQLKGLVASISNTTFASEHILLEAFFNVAFLINNLRTPVEKDILFREMVRQPCYEETIIKEWHDVDLDSVGLQQNTTDAVLAEHYLLYLLRDPDLNKPEQKEHLDSLMGELIDAVHGMRPKINSISILQNRTVLDKLTTAEQDRLVVHLVDKYQTEISKLKNSVLIKDIVLPDAKRSVLLFKALAGCQNFTSICSRMRKFRPGCDAGYILHLLRDPQFLQNPFQRHQQLVSFVRRTIPDNNVSALADPKFIGVLSEEEGIDLGVALINAHPPKPNQNGIWQSIVFLDKLILMDPKYAVSLFRACQKHDKLFNKFHIPKYVRDVSKNVAVLNALENCMTTDEKNEWSQYPV